MKTVVEAELYDGTRIALGAQYPNSHEQLSLQLERADEFLGAVSREGLDVDAPLLRALLKASKGQLFRELRMTQEAKNVKHAVAFYERLNQEMKSSLGGWRFKVPGLPEGISPTDSVLATEFVTGVSFKKLPAGPEKDLVGKLIVEGALRSLFREGFFDPDRHFGNVLVDVVAKIIRPLDFGQAEDFETSRASWSSDERYQLALILLAAEEGDVGDAVENVLSFGSSPQKLPASTQQRLEAALTEAFAVSHNGEERLTAIARTFAEVGVELDDKLLISGLKGLMTLSKEHYVAPEVFRSLLAHEAGRLLASKSARWARDDSKGLGKNAWAAAKAALKSPLHRT
jgi:predicted unusual protein kinase regulating ubiquinone biosynthesis (AarF/ABC1/UbiB family)